MPRMQDAYMKSPRHNPSVRSAEKRRFPNMIERRSRMSDRVNIQFRKTITTAAIIVLLQSSSALGFRGTVCPPKCSCQPDLTAFCNNNGYVKFPMDIPSNIRGLYLFNNNISTIPVERMRKLKNLTLLDLSGNRITNYALWEGIFSRLTNLENLMLPHNNITKITADMFKGLKKLARIYLQFNQISEIEKGAFNNLPSLVELKLQHNRFGIFPRLQGTPDLLLLDLSHNKLRTISDMALSTVNVEKLFLQGNQLTQLRTSIFDDTSRLNVLDISQNRLTAVPQIIKSLESLHFLNMSSNAIRSIPLGTFKRLGDLKTLDLHHMSLTSLVDGIIPNGLILNVFDISQNNWKCDCHTKWLPQYMTIFEESFTDPNKTRCASPPRLFDRVIRDLKERDFECAEGDFPPTLAPPIVSVATTTTKPKKAHVKPIANPCDVYHCFNNRTCITVDFMPRCQCGRNFAGERCEISLTTSKPITTTTTTRKKPATPKATEHPGSLLVDSVTENSVEIILPKTHTELLVSVSEIDTKQTIKEVTIKPKMQLYKVIGLEAGKLYSICIHSAITSQNPSYRNNKDSLCAEVKTGVTTILETPKTQISPGRSRTPPKGPPTSQKKENRTPTTATENDDFQILYPAIGAGLGVVIIIVVFVMFYVCYRQKRLSKLKRQNNEGLYLPGSQIDPAQANMADIEMATVVHHHHHNHYSAGNAENNASGKSLKKSNAPETNMNNKQGNFISNNGRPLRVGSPIKTSSPSRSSNSSSSNCGTLQTCFIESSQNYGPPQQHYIPPGAPSHPQYDLPHQHNLQANGRGNELVYMNHQNNNNSALGLTNNNCIPSRRSYKSDIMEERQPLVNGMDQFHCPNVEPQLYPVTPINAPQYIPQTAGVAYPQSNSRSAFHPIQSPRKNTVRTPTSDSGPITTHVNTAQVLPTSTCMGRNIVNDTIPIYHSGVPVA